MRKQKMAIVLLMVFIATFFMMSNKKCRASNEQNYMIMYDKNAQGNPKWRRTVIITHKNIYLPLWDYMKEHHIKHNYKQRLGVIHFFIGYAMVYNTKKDIHFYNKEKIEELYPLFQKQWPEYIEWRKAKHKKKEVAKK
jgi:hypothetical protein